MSPTAYAVLAVILAIALFFWSLPFWAEPRQHPKHRIDPEHEAWLRSMTDPQTPEDWARSHEGDERLLAAIHEQTLRDGDDYIHEATDGDGGQR